MFKNILVPIDGSPTATLAVAKAAGLAQAFGSTVTVLYVIDPYPFTGVGADFAYGQEQYLSAAQAVASTSLDEVRQTLQTTGVNATMLVVEGHSVHRHILETAQSTGADLIVMGSHGRRGIEKLVLGSVARRVLGDTHLPVLVVRDCVGAFRGFVTAVARCVPPKKVP